MRVYKVNAITVNGNGRIFNFGETVREDNFPPGRAEILRQRDALILMKDEISDFRDLRIGILVPDRGDRPDFMKKCWEMIERQTVYGELAIRVHIADYAPESSDIDITQRYKRGCNVLFKEDNCNVVIFMENDDWYAPNYIETILKEWAKAGRTEIFGIGQTVYYHIFTNQWVLLRHRRRASMMSSMVTSKILNIRWPRDNNPYLDVELWDQLRGKTFIPPKHICIGIKHGIGIVGGGAHNGDNQHYKNVDADGAWLRGIIGEDYKFYEQLKKNYDPNN